MVGKNPDWYCFCKNIFKNSSNFVFLYVKSQVSLFIWKVQYPTKKMVQVLLRTSLGQRGPAQVQVAPSGNIHSSLIDWVNLSKPLKIYISIKQSITSSLQSMAHLAQISGACNRHWISSS